MLAKLDVRRLGRSGKWSLVIGSLAVLGICVTARYYWPSGEAIGGNPERSIVSGSRSGSSNTGGAAFQKPVKLPNNVAIINGEKITRVALARECLLHYGEQVLKSILNRHLILAHCEKNNVQVTSAEIDKEIQRLATRFGMSVERWMTLLQQERGTSPARYRRDVVWPTLALRKLAYRKVAPTEKEIREAYEAEFGQQIIARMIAIVDDPDMAYKLRSQAAADPSQFGRLARKYSKDTLSASQDGRIPPITRHIGEKEIENVAFQLEVGQVSRVIQIRNQYLILICDKKVPAQNTRFSEVAPKLAELIRQRKLKKAAGTLFAKLKQETKIINVYNDPKLRKQFPGVAATINNHHITMRQLAEECILRNGEDALEGMINRQLLEQAMKTSNMNVTQADITSEIEDVAGRLMPKHKGKPDVEGWLKRMTDQPNVTRAMYVNDVVWPSVALRKLVEKEITITEQEIDKAFDANYGARVRVRVIVMDDIRRAQRVWDKARKEPTSKNFGKLAKEYSVDGDSAYRGGEIAPIQKNGGRTVLEDAAFALEKGEISGIVHYNDRYLVMFCEGHTQPDEISKGDKQVRGLLIEHIRRKKLHNAMEKKFVFLQESARVVNNLNPRQSREPKVARGRSRKILRR